MNLSLQNQLKKILNGRFSQSESTRANYARGEDTYDPVLSQAVVFPETNEEVSQILKEVLDGSVGHASLGSSEFLKPFHGSAKKKEQPANESGEEPCTEHDKTAANHRITNTMAWKRFMEYKGSKF